MAQESGASAESPESGGRGRPAIEEALGNARALRGRLVLGALAAVGVLVALALVLVWRQYEDAKREAADELQARAILAATVFDTYFDGQLGALSAIAASPAVTNADAEAMSGYFARFRPGSGTAFTAGVGWIDLQGRQRATSDPRGPVTVSLADRSYFRTAVATKKPVVGEAIVARTSGRRLVVMGVPSRDRRGRLNGVVAGGIVLQPSGTDARATDLGYSGLQVIDRENQQVTRRDLARPANDVLVGRLRRESEGVLIGQRGLEGTEDRVVAFATAATPGWVTVLDQPASSVFADARRTLALEAALVGAAAVVVLGLIGWAARRARRDLRAGQAQVANWAHLTRALNDALDAGAVRRTLATALAREFPQATVVVSDGSTDSDDSGSAAVVRGRRSPALADGATLKGIADAVASTAEPFALETEGETREALQPRAVERLRSLYGVSLAAGDADGREGVAMLLFAQEHAVAEHERPLLSAYAEQARQALARVHRHQAEHDVAVLLQQSLLPDTLPEAPGVESAAFYRAGALDANVGGDWYDIVRRPDGLVHLTVGDVAGHGIEAAILMGQLRHAFRAYALEHVSPAAVVERLSRHVPDDGMATMVCVTYDACTRELAYASAGHPPPLLADPSSRSVSLLDRTSTGPLGWPDQRAPEDVSLTVAADATLVLYTDGLVERRDAPLDQGIEWLRLAVLETLDDEPSRAVASIVGQLAVETDDDIALLLVRLGPSPNAVRIELPAESGDVRELRRRVRGWLAERGVDSDRRADAVLALNEAVVNAIEHGHRDVRGTITIQLRHRTDRLEITVDDQGTWREPVADDTRGRGIQLMRGLMDRAEIQQSAGGTTVLLEQRL
jgi:serine phosphatase RsbU (regulator of sigma subunit)/anti-sigma regulatory factor (Ser/Thr protein kinase)